MNTIRSTWIGWGVLGIAGGGAYYFAKKQVNADRAARHEADMQRKARYQNIESSVAVGNAPKTKRKKALKGDGNFPGDAANSHAESGKDGATAGNRAQAEQQKTTEKSKYEAEEPYISMKGDRLR